MRSVKIGLALAVMTAIPVVWVAGCSADGGSGVEDAPDTGTTDDSGGSSSSSSSSSSSGSSGQDSGKDTGSDAKSDAKDSAVSDATDAKVEAEAGPTAPNPGDPCTTPGAIFNRTCGFCGSQQAVCEATKTVSDYSFCTGEVAGGCTPGSTRMSDCGKCGKRNEVCQNNCTWAAGACTGEPPSACTPGEDKYITAGCTVPSTFRKQTCMTNCQFGAPSPLPCFDFPPDVTIATTVGGIADYAGNLSPLTDKIARLNTGSCPTTLSTSLTTYNYTVVKNTTAQTAQVEIYYTAPAGGTDIDTITTVYPVPPPKSDAERMACTGKINDFCSTAPCTTSWSGLVGADAPSIPPGASIVVYTAAYFTTDTGPFVMHLKTKSLL
jgi:hypothetical protein